MDWKVNPLVAEKAQAAKFSFVRARPLAKKTARLIGKETLKKRISIKEHRISNIEVMYSIDLY
jgi:hypothetical protein